MSIETYSAFTYGHTITEDNSDISFNEGSGEIVGSLDIGGYTLEQYAIELNRVLNENGTLEYTVTVDRSTRKITISSTGAFDLLISSGSSINTSTFGLAGFTGADLTGLLTYEGDSASGSIYEPQFLLQSFIDFQDQVKSASPSVNQSASGIVEVVKYGNINLMSCNITYATNILNQGVIINNATGVDDLRSFMEYAITKAPMEFIPDKDGLTYTNCLLESTAQSREGVDFTLRELYGRGLAGYFETGNISFRELKD